MLERQYRTRCGVIHYWVSKKKDSEVTLVFLPGLTADHHLFDRQIVYFEEKYSVFVWDAPGHASSWPFDFAFDLSDKAAWLFLEKLRNQTGMDQKCRSQFEYGRAPNGEQPDRKAYYKMRVRSGDREKEEHR